MPLSSAPLGVSQPHAIRAKFVVSLDSHTQLNALKVMLIVLASMKTKVSDFG